MKKTLNQTIFFSSTKIRIFVQQHWESEYFFRKKNITPPPLEVKWSVPHENCRKGCIITRENVATISINVLCNSILY